MTMLGLLVALLVPWSDPSVKALDDRMIAAPDGMALCYRHVRERIELRWLSFAIDPDTLGPLVITLRDGRRLVPVEWFLVGPPPELRPIPIGTGLRIAADQTWRLPFRGRTASVAFAAFREPFAVREIAKAEMQSRGNPP